MNKSEYIRTLMFDRPHHKTLLDAALIFWHSNIKAGDALNYMNNLEARLRENNHIV